MHPLGKLARTRHNLHKYSRPWGRSNQIRFHYGYHALRNQSHHLLAHHDSPASNDYIECRYLSSLPWLDAKYLPWVAHDAAPLILGER